MKKVFCAISFLALIYQSDAMSVESYARHSHKFSKNTDLIRGYILSSDGILKTERFLGNVKYFYESGKQYDGNSCSFLDCSQRDPVADLLIQLFPSCGSSLNAQGNGAIAFVPVKQIDFIVGMFNIDTDIRQNRENSDVFSEIKAIDDLAEADPLKNILIKRFGAKYFHLKRGKIEYFTRLFRLGKNIANAVMSERLEKTSTTVSYPPFYTNDLICAYVWNALPANKLDKLARKLGYMDERKAYQSDMTIRILEEMQENPSLVPFYAGQQIITNSVTEYQGQRFADCVETAVRQLFSCIFCTSVLNSNGKYTGELVIDLSRIPEQAVELREFFAPGGKLRNIRELANDGNPEIRAEWAAIVSGHTTIGENEFSKPFISYADVDHNMFGGWNNTIKMFCFLMDGYSANQGGDATPKKLTAEKRIKEVNASAKMGTFAVTKDTLLEIMNDLLGVRTDVEMVAEVNPQMGILQDASSDIEGCISIYPKNHEKGNRLDFISYKNHGQLLSIPRTKHYLASPSSSVANTCWIESLYYNRELAIRGKEINPAVQSYPNLSESAYPILDFYVRISGGIRQEWIIPTLCDILNTSTPHVDAVARMFFDIDTPHILFELLDAAQEKEVPLQHLINICELISEYSTCRGNAISAIRFLRKHTPDATEKFLCTISETCDQRDLIIQRMAFGRCRETDPIIENLVKTHSTKEVFELFFKIYASYAAERKIPSDVPIFPETMLNAFIPHIQDQIEKIKCNGVTNEIDIYGILGILDLIDIKEIPYIVSEFTEIASKTQKPHFFPLIPNIDRSRAKLDLLLPISYVPNISLADKIFEEYSGIITPSIAASIIMRISEENIPLLLTKVTVEKLSIPFIRELIGKDNCRVNNDIAANKDRIKKIVGFLFEKYGKFNDEIANELIDTFPEISSFIISHAEFSPKLKDIFINKFDASVNNQFENYQISLLLLNSEYAFIPEVTERIMGIGCGFWAQFSIDTQDKMKEMSDTLILNISKHFEKVMRKFIFDGYMPEIRDSLVMELEKRNSISTTEKEKLIEELKNYCSDKH